MVVWLCVPGQLYTHWLGKRSILFGNFHVCGFLRLCLARKKIRLYSLQTSDVRIAIALQWKRRHFSARCVIAYPAGSVLAVDATGSGTFAVATFSIRSTLEL
jgi:hypothetical protein